MNPATIEILPTVRLSLILLPHTPGSKLSLGPWHTQTTNPNLSMSVLTIEMMKQLLSDQATTLLSELKVLVKTEVSNQLEPNISRLNQLHDEQAKLREQFNSINCQYRSNIQSKPVDHPIRSPLPTPVHHNVPMPKRSTPDIPESNPGMLAIEKAKCTLTFHPITQDDLDRMKLCTTENAPTSVLLERALQEFLDINMSIPPSVISKMNISQIWHIEETYFDKISVTFSNMDSVNTIFKYVKNLSPGQQVSISITPSAA
jgi:hypothetical protein